MKIVCIKMKYSIEPSDRIYVKGYWFLSFAKTMGKSLSNRYAKIGDLIGRKIADKITSVSKKRIAF